VFSELLRTYCSIEYVIITTDVTTVGLRKLHLLIT